MKNLSVLLIFGTRPEAIKMAPVIEELVQFPNIKTQICVTGQHREMLDQILKLFSIKPEYDLNLMKAGQNLTQLTSGIMVELEKVLVQSKPDRVIIHGDTTTTMAASLASFYQKIPVAHVESGLRSKDIYSPWPEEVNRKITSVIADLHFAPTESARQNLINESIQPDRIFVTGNTVIDALLKVSSIIEQDKSIKSKLEAQFTFLDTTKKMLLVTAHRRESFGQGFENIARALRTVAERKDVQIVYPLHPNPNVRGPIREALSNVSNIFLIEPQDYLPFIYLMKRSFLILTDSGGVQEEAPSLNKPVLVLRKTTERFEGIEAGTSKLIGTDYDSIVSIVNSYCAYNNLSEHMTFPPNPYGDGKASARIVHALIEKHNIKA